MDIIKESSGLNGLEQLTAFIEAGRRAPIARTLGFDLVEVAEGFAALQGEPDESVYNPMGSVHGGYAAAMLDSVCGFSVHTRLTAEQSYTTLELKVAFHRALSNRSGRIRAEGRVLSFGRRVAFAEGKLVDGEGRLCASATSTLLIMER
jgi:uncharacterized protein (TIGR00369 family)